MEGEERGCCKIKLYLPTPFQVKQLHGGQWTIEITIKYNYFLLQTPLKWRARVNVSKESTIFKGEI